jgi:RNA polymerase sigma-70 factor, ECF subfamily
VPGSREESFLFTGARAKRLEAILPAHISLGVATSDASSEEQKLMLAAQAGDRRALESLLAREQPRIWRFSMKMCGNRDDAGDVLQNTLLAMARTVRNFHGASSVSTWLYTIARSYCIKKHRRSKFAPRDEKSLEADGASAASRVPDAARTPEEELGRREVGAAVEGAIRSLEPKYREVLVLRDVEGLSAPEVAKVLGIRVDAVKSRLHRARVVVRAALAPALGTVEAPRTPACPDVVTLFSKYLEDDIDPQHCAKMQAHVKKCPHCEGACESLQKALSLCRASPTPRVPPDVQLTVRRAIRRFIDAEA